MNDTILVALIGLVAGVLGFFIAPWANWGVEKRRSRYESRKKRVNDVREFVLSKQFGVKQFQQSGFYSKISSDLSEETVNMITNPPENLEGEKLVLYREEVRQTILGELNNLEREWKII